MRFLVFVAALGLLVASLYLALIFGNVPYAALQRLGQVAYYEYAPDGPNYLTLALTPGSYKALRIGSWGLLACSSLATIAVLQKAIFRREILRLKLECSLATTALATVIRSLTVGQRLLAAMLLLLTLGAQVLWLLNDPLSPDEIGSYDAFVHEGPAAIASFYPIPNNHVGYNFLSWLMAQVLPGSVRLTLRLPSLLVATAGTALSYALLTRISNFRVATLVTALFGLTKLTIIYAAAGRGYYLQLACLQLAFFATYELATGGRYRRLSWAVFTSASVIGLYAIPTFALPLASLAAALLVAGRKFGPGHRRLFWTQGLFTLAVIGAISFVLYTPVGCVSGWRQLLGNRYLAPYSMVAFWNLSRAYLYETTSMLLGPVRPGLIAVAGTLALTPLVLLRNNISAQTKQLAWTCWGLLVLPLVLMLAQRVLIPARVLMYTTYFLYLLAALGVDWVALRWKKTPVAWIPMVLLAALPVCRMAEFGLEIPALFQSRDRAAGVHRAYHWLRRQPRGPVFIRAPFHAIMFHHLALLEKRNLTLDAHPVPGVRYSYFVQVNDQSAQPAWMSPVPGKATYQDEMITIYALK